MKPGRIPCSVPFCRRTGKKDGDTLEIICAKHWRATNKTLRRRYRKAYRRAEVYVCDDVTIPREEYDRLESMWKELKRQAIEKAVGI